MNKRIGFLFLSAFLLLSGTLPSIIVNANENNTSDTNEVNVGIEQGEFTLRTSETIGFGNHIIEKKKKVVTTAFESDFGVIDARGTQEGWTVTVSATPFTMIEPSGGFILSTGEGTIPYSLPMGSLSLTTLMSVTGVNQEPQKFHPSINTINVAIDMNETVKIATADAGKGMGEYSLTFGVDALSLVIDPLTAKVDTVNYPDTVTPYMSTLTWNLISGPEDDSENNEEPIENIASDFIYEIINNEVSILGYKGETKNVVIPNEIEDFPVIYIGKNAFSEKKLTNVTFPDTLKEIGDDAFILNSLKIVHIPNNVISIGNKAFGHNQLTDVYLSDSVKYIGESAFINNYIEFITLPENLTEIKDNTFADNSLKIVEMPNSITKIGKEAFKSNEIRRIEYSNNLEYIDDYAFYNNYLYLFSPPDSLKYVGKNSFDANLINLIVTNKIEHIGENAFINNLLEHTTIDKELKSIGENAFKYNNLPQTVNNYSSLNVKEYFEPHVSVVELQY